jgi:hypothetical protein
VPSKIKTAVERLREKEQVNRYHTARNAAPLGYTMFGNLAQIIIASWDEFSDLFPGQAWVTSRFNDPEGTVNLFVSKVKTRSNKQTIQRRTHVSST